MKRIALKSLTIFLIFMFICTVVSRAADSLTVAKVSVETVSAKKIEHIVNADGMVEKNRELAVIAEADLLVKTVYVSEGEKVEENTVLAQVDLSQLEEVMQGIRNEIKALQLQNAQATETEEASKKAKETAQKRANEDYNRAVQENTTALQQAQKELQAAKEALSAYEESKNNRTDKQLGLGENAQAAPQNDDLIKDSPEDISSGAASQSAESEETELQSLQGLQAEVKRAQEAYDAAAAACQQAIQEAGRQVEDAEDSLISNDVSIEINQMTIEEKQEKLEKLEKLKQQEGKIMAPVTGVITQIYVSVGQKTSDTAAFTLADLSSGMRFVAEISKEDGQYVQVGDDVTLKAKTADNSVFQLNIQSVEEKEDGENLTVTVLLPSDSLTIGDSAKMSVSKQSELYGTAVPYSAIHSEAGRDYVYVAEKQQTILGEEYMVRALEVEILEKNEKYAALSEGAVDSEAKIITESDRYIEAGSRVRLQEQ